MTVRISEEAVGVIRRSLELAKLDPARAGVRLRMAGGQVRPRFTAEPEPGDLVVEADGVRVFLQQDIAASHPDLEVTVTPEHEQLVVRPVGEPGR